MAITSPVALATVAMVPLTGAGPGSVVDTFVTMHCDCTLTEHGALT